MRYDPSSLCRQITRTVNNKRYATGYDNLDFPIHFRSEDGGWETPFFSMLISTDKSKCSHKPECPHLKTHSNGKLPRFTKVCFFFHMLQYHVLRRVPLYELFLQHGFLSIIFVLFCVVKNKDLFSEKCT